MVPQIKLNLLWVETTLNLIIIMLNVSAKWTFLYKHKLKRREDLGLIAWEKRHNLKSIQLIKRIYQTLLWKECKWIKNWIAKSCYEKTKLMNNKERGNKEKPQYIKIKMSR